jgi:hypothetical protein
VPDNIIVLTNEPDATAATSNPTTLAAATNATGAKPGGHHSGHVRAEHPVFHTVYVLAGDTEKPVLRAVRVKTGITDGISTEVISGLDQEAQVVTGVIQNGALVTGGSNPFGGGGGFPRMR